MHSNWRQRQTVGGPLCKRLIVSFFLCCGLFAGIAHAHSMTMFADFVDDEIHGFVRWGDGSPARDLTVQIMRPPKRVAKDYVQIDIGSVRTDDKGRFKYTPPDTGEYELKCRTDDGHGVSISVNGSNRKSTLQREESNTLGDEQISRQIHELREQLHEYEQRTRLRDVLGGIGYILGLAGVVALMKTRRRET